MSAGSSGSGIYMYAPMNAHVCAHTPTQQMHTDVEYMVLIKIFQTVKQPHGIPSATEHKNNLLKFYDGPEKWLPLLFSFSQMEKLRFYVAMHLDQGHVSGSSRSE